MNMQKNLADNLKAKLQGDQQLLYELVTRTKISKTIMLKYLHGDGNPRLDTLEQLCETLNMTPNQLLLQDDCVARVQDKQVLWAQMLEAIPGVSEFPFEAQTALFNLYLKVVSIYQKHDVPHHDDVIRELHKIAGKTEA